MWQVQTYGRCSWGRGNQAVSRFSSLDDSAEIERKRTGRSQYFPCHERVFYYMFPPEKACSCSFHPTTKQTPTAEYHTYPKFTAVLA